LFLSFFMSSPWLISTHHELPFSSSHSDRMKHRMLLRYKGTRIVQADSGSHSESRRKAYSAGRFGFRRRFRESEPESACTIRARFLHALQLVSTVLNESRIYDQFMSSAGLLVVTCVLFSYRGFHSCSSVADSEHDNSVNVHFN
jgi:hypothetical protein